MPKLSRPLLLAAFESELQRCRADLFDPSRVHAPFGGANHPLRRFFEGSREIRNFHFVARFDRGKGRIAHGVPFLPVTEALRLEASGYRNKRKYLDVELKLRTYTQSGFPENQQSGGLEISVESY